MEAIKGPTTIAVPVRGSDQVAQARRIAAAAASAAGLSEEDAGRAALAATEAATNLVKHATEGEVLVNARGGPAAEVELLAIDKGPGMRDVARCFQDGYSTAGSAGTGLGAIQRISSECDVYSEEGRGTVVLSRIRPSRYSASPRQPDVKVGAVSAPLRGESVCGDAWAMHEGPGYVNLLVVDGLGHGHPAADCATAAVAAFCETPDLPPSELVRSLHAAVRSTRGGAASAARIDRNAGEVRFAGVGNVGGLIASNGSSRHMAAQPGIVGHDVRNVKEFTYRWSPGDAVLLYSDGLSSHWDLNAYRGIATRDPSILAAILYRDWSRKRDDATVVVCRIER